jgi:alkylresorcinol/alkylpyrone synthase
VLVVSVELPTLSFQRDDLSAANLVSTALFGDGAAAALLTGRDLPAWSCWGRRATSSRARSTPSASTSSTRLPRGAGARAAGLVRGEMARS